MYYAIEPEVPGNKLEVYSATSSDGINWVPENGIRRTFTVFPDVIKLPDGTWRMYFQNAGVIKSATSSDGLLWKDESGIRIDLKNNEELHNFIRTIMSECEGVITDYEILFAYQEYKYSFLSKNIKI